MDTVFNSRLRSNHMSKMGGTHTLMMDSSSVLCQMHESTNKRLSLKHGLSLVRRLKVRSSSLTLGRGTTSTKYTSEMMKKAITTAHVMSVKNTTSSFDADPKCKTACFEVRNSGCNLTSRGSTRNISRNKINRGLT